MRIGRHGSKRTIYFPDDLWKELERRRVEIGVPVSTNISRAVRRYLRG